MTTLNEYANKYSSVRMRREDGILEMQFHTDGGPLRWSKLAHGDLEGAFLDAGRDRDNQVIIMIFNPLHDLCSELIGAHFRLQIVSGYPW